MIKLSPRQQTLIEQGIAVSVFLILVMYIYVHFFQVPYVGFDWNSSNGQVSKIFVKGELQIDDRLIRVDQMSFNEFQTQLHQPLFKEYVHPGEKVTLLVKRGQQTLLISWLIPKATTDEIVYRLYNQWWLGLLFWLAGEATLFLVRPKDHRWWLLIAFYFLTAIWLVASASSRTHVWDSAIVLRATIWLSVPVYLFLHWVFPRPFTPLPISVLAVGTLIGLALAAAQWFDWLPPSLYVIGLLLAVGGSLVLLLIHFLKGEHRQETRLLLIAAGAIVFVSLFSISLLTALGILIPRILLALPTMTLLPASYFYAAYRRQLAGMEIRSNRIISVYLFLVLMGVIFTILVPLADVALDLPGKAILIGLGAATLASIMSIFSLAPFQRFIEHILLKIPHSPTHLVNLYSARLAVSLDMSILTRLLRDDILSSLLVRESALLRFDSFGSEVLYASGVEPSWLPKAAEVVSLQQEPDRYRTPTAATQPCPWVRLALILSLDQKPVGLWLLGRRDPDDFYAPGEIAILKSIANQTAIALVNIAQADRLRALYDADIDQRETERLELARKIHDIPLHELARLKASIDASAVSPQFFEIYDKVADSLRLIVTDLRPAMLNYGLYAALKGLVVALSGRPGNYVDIVLELAASSVRYDPKTELHVYRIMQQACENALRHAKCKNIKIHGRLTQPRLEVTAEDDGDGFETGEQLDLARLVAHKHFGLAGMVERAGLINAEIHINSTPGQGTWVHVLWNSNGRDSDHSES